MYQNHGKWAVFDMLGNYKYNIFVFLPYPEPTSVNVYYKFLSWMPDRLGFNLNISFTYLSIYKDFVHTMSTHFINYVITVFTWKKAYIQE